MLKSGTADKLEILESIFKEMNLRDVKLIFEYQCVLTEEQVIGMWKHGMKAYLKENGINEMEERDYFKDFVSKHLEIIETNDLKEYFLHIPF